MFNILSQKKICSKCLGVKPVSEFKKHKETRDKLNPVCNACQNDYQKKWYSIPANAQKAKDRNKKNNAMIANYKREWKQKNPNYYAEYVANHKENILASSRKYAAQNLGKRAVYEQNRRALVKGSGGKITPEEWKELCEKYGNRCLCCGRSDVKLTIDHVLPLKLGGRNVIENAQPLCQSCNAKKNAKHIDYRGQNG